MRISEVRWLLFGLVLLFNLKESSSIRNDPGSHFVNSFVVRVDGDRNTVNEIAETCGFRVKREIEALGVFELHHHEVPHRSKRSSEHLHRLRDHPKVLHVEQQEALVRVKREMVYDKQQELEIRTFEDEPSISQFVKKGMDDSRPCECPKNVSRPDYNDKYFKLQWNLCNCVKEDGSQGVDLNVVIAWKSGFTGKGVRVTNLDDGLDHTHPDLKKNYDKDASADFNSKEKNDDDPMPNDRIPDNSHGTRCAGIIAAEADNAVCGVGVAYNAGIGGVRILDGTITDTLEAQALIFKLNYIDIISASWGPKDDGKTMETPRDHAREALQKGVAEVCPIPSNLLEHPAHLNVSKNEPLPYLLVFVNDGHGPMIAKDYWKLPISGNQGTIRSRQTSGRNGKGRIFVWATGNGGKNDDDCNADGYVSSIETLSVGSIKENGARPYFMEMCSSTLAVVPTGGETHPHDDDEKKRNGETIVRVVTTDLHHRCTTKFEGTSAAAPMAAGCVALALEANKDLTWRDVQHIVVQTARISSADGDWLVNGAGLHINHKYGFGVMDCGRMVQEAQTWKNKPPQHICQSERLQSTDESWSVDSVTNKPIMSKMEIDGCDASDTSRIDALEHVQLHIKVGGVRRGNIHIFLTSPSGTKSQMLKPRKNDNSKEEIDFVFMTVHHWGESPKGTWTLQVINNKIHDKIPDKNDKKKEKSVLKLEYWQLTLYGTATHSLGTREGETVGQRAWYPSHQDLERMMTEEKRMSDNVQIKRQEPTDAGKKRKLDSLKMDLIQSLDEYLSDHEFDDRSLNERKRIHSLGFDPYPHKLHKQNIDLNDKRHLYSEIAAEINHLEKEKKLSRHDEWMSKRKHTKPLRNDWQKLSLDNSEVKKRKNLEMSPKISLSKAKRLLDLYSELNKYKRGH